MNTDIVVSGQYTKAHFARAVALANGPSRRSTALRAVAGVLFAAAFAYLLYDYLASGARGAVWLGRRAISLAIVAYVLFWPYVSNWLLVRRLWKGTQADPAMQARLDVKGLTILPSDAEVQFPWDNVARLHIEPDMIVPVMPDGTFAVLPSTFFSSDSEWQRARDLIRSRVKPVVQGTA